jgi:hypothetical protein
MLHRVSDLIGHHLEARDGSIGKVKDLLFDDDVWTVRYLVADTGRWLASRRVLLSPFSVMPGAMDAKRLPVNLTKTQSEKSPSIETDLPVSEQHQRDLHAYYGWPPYWGIEPARLPRGGGEIADPIDARPRVLAAGAFVGANKHALAAERSERRILRRPTGVGRFDLTDAGSLAHPLEFVRHPGTALPRPRLFRIDRRDLDEFGNHLQVIVRGASGFQ